MGKEKRLIIAIEHNIQHLKQKIVSALVISVMFALVFTTINLNPNYVRAATSNVQLNVAAGTLSIDSSSGIDLGTMTAGNSQTMEVNNMVVNVKDFAGDGLGWSSTAYSSNFKNGVGGTRDIPNSRSAIKSSPGGIVYNIDSASCSETALSGECYLNQTCAFFNGSANATGECRLNYTILRLYVLQTDPAGYYNATLTLTVTAG